MKTLRTVAWSVLLGTVCGLAAGAPQATLRHRTFSDFQGGKAENVAVLGTGGLELGMAFEACKELPAEAFVWALAADSKGRVYAGTGNSGKVFAIEGGKVRVALAADDLQVLSLAVDAKDNVYAGCAPSGRIYQIPPRGEPKVFCETKETYVWALAVDDKGRLWAGTGPEGRILRISPDGSKVETAYDSRESHILCIAAVGPVVYAGTDENGLVYRVAADGKVSIAFDAPNRELRCMTADGDGNVYVGSADGIRGAPTLAPRRLEPARPVSPAPTGAGEAMDVARPVPDARAPAAPVSAPAERSGAVPVAAANAVWRIAADGKVTEFVRLNRVAFLSLAWHNGSLYCGTAGEGRVFRVASPREAAVAAQHDQPTVLSVCSAGGRLITGTGAEARVYVAESERAQTGTYTSDVFDARVRSAWGAIQVDAELPGGTGVEVSTRSGNSEKPDETWSAWSEPRKAGGPAAVESPPARFIQYRLALSTRDVKTGPRVREVRLPYLVDNYPPAVESVDVAAVAAGARAADSSKKPPPAPAKTDGTVCGTVSVTWRASDPNGDTLEYELLFRGRGEKKWKTLKAELRETTFAWDTQAVPDGVYELQVIASDRPENPPPRALTGMLTSEPVTVDNTPPVVKIERTRYRDGRAAVEAEVQDGGSNVAAARYSVDAGPWRALLPADQVFDGRAEKLTLETDRLEPGEHTLVIQAEDSAGNVGSAKTTFE